MSSSKISYTVILGLLCVISVIALTGLILSAVALDRHKSLNTKTTSNNSDIKKLKGEVTKNTLRIATNNSDIEIQKGEINKINDMFGVNPIKLMLNPTAVVDSNGRFKPKFNGTSGLLYMNSIFKIEIDDSNFLKITLDDSTPVPHQVRMRIIYSKYNITRGESTFGINGFGFQLVDGPPAIEYSDHGFGVIPININPTVFDSTLIRYDVKGMSGIFYLTTDAGEGTITNNFDGFMEIYFY